MTVDLDLLLQLMGERRSERSFLPRPVEEVKVRRLLEAACSAPSASNRQPYRFMVVRRETTKRRMAAAVAAAVQRRLNASEAAFGVEPESYAKNFLHFENAPVVFVVVFRARSFGSLALGNAAQDPVEEVREALSSAAAAIMQLLLATHAMGLGACWMTGPSLAERELLELLKAPVGWRLAALVPVGYPAQRAQPPPRRSIEQLELAEPDSTGPVDAELPQE